MERVNQYLKITKDGPEITMDCGKNILMEWCPVCHKKQYVSEYQRPSMDSYITVDRHCNVCGAFTSSNKIRKQRRI